MAGSVVTVTKVAFNRIPQIARAISSGGDDIVQKTATDLQADVLISMEGARRGRRYGDHVASAPGEKPARYHGALAGGIGVKRGYRRATVFASSSYAPHLEWGTRNMAPRPFMRPAARKAQAVFAFAVNVMLQRATK
jgi:HK97 gp10 family phage protein